MITARTIGGPAYPEMVEEMDGELNNIAEHFSHAVMAEMLCLADEISKLSFLKLLIFDPKEFGVERADREQAEQERLE